MLINNTYEILDEIGRGGMSVIYRARHVRLNTIFAIKQIRKSQDANLDFSTEANLLKRLNHPMLVRISDIFEDAENLYIVEDFVDGEDLTKVLKKQGSIPEETLVEWLKDLCGVLEYLHEQKPRPVIFRDMKPSNIMLQKDGSLKLIDFGIAREYKAESRMDTTLVGTYGYAAPEQFNTKMQSDARTDIYALGMTMHHLATGKSPLDPPYTAVPVRELKPQLSAGLEHIIAKCIQQEPQDRYQNVKEILHDLENIHTFDRKYRIFQRNKLLLRLFVVLLAVSGISLIVYGNSLNYGNNQDKPVEKSAELEEYYHLIEQAKGMPQEEAFAYFEEAKALYPDRLDVAAAEINYYFDNSFSTTKDYGNVVTLFKELGDSGAKLLTDFPKSGEIVGKSYYALAMYEEAASVYETMLEGIDDPNPKIYLEYATTCSSLGDYERAKKVLEESDSLFAGDYANLMQAQLSSMQGNYLDAETKYLEVIHSHVIDFDMLPEAYIGLAETYLDSYINYYAADESQRIEDALKKCSSLIEQAEANRKLGNLKRLNEIRNFVLDHSDDSNPGYIGTETEGDSGLTSEKDFMNAFNSYAAVSQYGKALEVLDEYIREYPTDYYPHAVKALLLAQLQNDKEEPDYSEAMKQYEQTMSLLPHERPQDEILDRLEEMASWLRENGYAE